MGGTGSGRKQTNKTQIVMFGLDIQVMATSTLDKIKNGNATFDEVQEELVEMIRKARRVCEENERL